MSPNAVSCNRAVRREVIDHRSLKNWMEITKSMCSGDGWIYIYTYFLTDCCKMSAFLYFYIFLCLFSVFCIFLSFCICVSSLFLVKVSFSGRLNFYILYCTGCQLVLYIFVGAFTCISVFCVEVSLSLFTLPPMCRRQYVSVQSVVSRSIIPW